jgi:hypothetical protein
MAPRGGDYTPVKREWLDRVWSWRINKKNDPENVLFPESDNQLTLVILDRSIRGRAHPGRRHNAALQAIAGPLAWQPPRKVSQYTL